MSLGAHAPTAPDRRRAACRANPAEAIKKFAILPVDWSESGGQITPSLKLKRRVVLAEHAADIEKLYRGESSARSPG